MELLELFKRQLASTPNTSSKNTIKNYVSDVRHFISWFEAVTASKFEASSITPDVILLYQNSMGGLLLDGQLQINSQLSAASMKRHLSSIRKFFTVLEGENILRENPFKKIVTEETVEPTDYWHLKSFRDYLMMGKASKITVKNYLSDISGFARWYEEAVLPTVENPVSSNQGFYLITQAIVEDYRKRLVEIQNAAPRTINRKLSALRRYLEFATKKGFITNREINISSVEAEIAQEVQDLPKVPLSEISTQLTPQKRMYSKIPPVRLVQKLFVNPYLLLEEGAANAITTFLIGKKVTGIANLPQKLSAQIVAKNALRVQNQGLSTLLSVRNIEKEFYAPEKISLSGLPIHQKLFHHVRFNRPNWYKRYHNYAFVHYIHFALLVIFASGVGVALYQNLVVQKQTPTFAAATAPPRILSFQGRLTDALDNPITSPQPVRFMIYNSLAATGAAELWEETRTISPDQDGIFSVLLGSDSTGANASSCGSFPPGSPYNTACLIPSTVFSDNSQIWLGVTIANSTELAPRQKIATVGYASNSEFLQGLPPTSAVSSFVNAVLALDSTGSFNLNDGIEHTFQVSNGTLTLKAQTLNLTTSLGTNGNIILNPEGSGKVDIQKPIINNSNTGNLVPGGVEINDKFGVLATESAVAAFIVNNNTTGGDIFAASSSGTTRFKIANDGSITSGFYTGQNAVLYGTQTTGVIGQVTTASTGLCLQSGASLPTWGTCGTSYWNLTTDNGALTPFSSTLDLLIGGQSTASAKFAFINNASGSPTASISGNLSIAVPTGANGANLFNIFNGGSLNFQTSGGGNAGLTSRLFIANDGRIGIGTTSPFSRNALDIRGLSGTSSTASISATSSYATLVVDNAGSGDLIAASASGVPNFVVKNNGDIIVGPGGGGKITAAIIDPYLIQNQKTTGIQSLTFQTLGASNADFVFQNTSTTLSTLTMAGQFQLPITGSTGGIVLGGDTQLFRGAADRIDIAANDSLNFLSGSGGLLTNGTTRIDASGNGTFANINITGTCTGCVNTGNSPFYVSQGAIVPGNTTLDFLLGGIATTSAKFAVLNIAGGTPTASVSAQNVAGQALVLGSDGTIQSTRNNNLTIGGSTTGSIILSPSNGSGAVGINTSSSISALEVKGRTGTGTVVVNNLPAATTYGAIGFSSPLDGNNYALAGVSGGEVILNSPANNPLSFRQGNQVYAIINSTTGYFGIGEAFASPLATLHVNGGDKGGRAAAIFDQVGASTNDILSASASGVTKFVIKNDGTASSSAGFTVDGIGSIQSTRNQTLTLGGGSTGNLVLGRTSQTVSLPGFTTNGGLLYTNASGVLAQTGTGGATQCLLGGAGTPTFGSCSGGTNTSPFYEIASQGIIVQGNTTEDFLLGGTASSSARFIVNGLATGVAPTASISATNGNGIYLSAQDGTIQSLRNNTLSIGGNTTGTVSINPLASNFTGIGTSNPRASLDIRRSLGIIGGGTMAVASISGRTSFASLLIDNSLGDLFSASSSGINRFVVTQNGNVGIGTTSPASKLELGSGQIALPDGTAAAPSLSFSGALDMGLYRTTSNLGFSVGGSARMFLIATALRGTSNDTFSIAIATRTSTTPTFSWRNDEDTGLGSSGANSLSLITGGTERLNIDSNGYFGIGTNTQISQLHITRPLTLGATGKALAVFDQIENQDIFTASASGVTKFTIGNDGQVMIGNINADPSTALGAGSIYYNTVSQALKFYNGSTWASIGTGSSSSGPFGVLQGAIVPTNTTYDFLLGGTATSSAKFSVLNLSGVATTIASVSGNLIVMPDNGTGGRVGIGTINPTNSLTIVGAPNITPVSISANRNTGNPDMAYFTNSASGGDSFVIGVGATGTNIPANTVGFGLATVGYRAFLTNSGLFGIGTSSPISALHITRPINYGATGKALAVFDQIENQDIFTASASGITRFVIKNDGRLGINTFQSPTGVNPTSVLQVYGLSTQPIASISGKTSGPTLLLTNDGTGDILAASVSGVQKFRINAAGDLIVGDGSGKIYGGGFDPLFTIDGKKFSTYASGINGMKEEYIGSANLTYDASAGGYAYTLDFNNFEYGSELWTFSRVIDPDLTKVNVLLTPTSQARTWFRRDPVNRKLILYSDRPTSVTFRFTAPRFDYALYPSSNHSHDIAGLQAPAAPNTTGTGEADPMDSFFASLSIQFNNGLFVVLDGFGNIVHRVDGFSNLIAANFEAGFIHAKNVAADTLSAGSASLGSATANTFAVAANTITIGGKDIRQFIIDTVTAAGFGQNTIISPLAEVETIKTNTIRPLADGGDITVKGKLITESDKSATDSASISLDVRGSASISGNLTVNNIQTNNATLAGSLTTTNASISGTLAARDINVNQLQIRDNLKVGTVRADFGIFEQGITSMGPVTANILTATDQLAVGSNFTISNNAINTVGTDLAIQSLRQGDIAFQGGLIRMDTDGNMTVNGNFNLLGEIDAVHGVFSGTLTTPALATDLISPVADSNISLSFKDSKFNIQNSKTATGSAVLSIDNKGNIQSSGSATFAKLNFNLVGKAEATSLSEAVATGSAGFASLRAGQPELTIKNNIITSKSLIYITPFGNTDNKVLYLLRQIPDSDTEDGSFTIGISGQVPNHDLQFNWLIVN